MNGIFSGVVVPIIPFVDCIPLRLCAFKCDARKPRAPVERRLADACDAISDCDARQPRALVERPITDARDAISYCDVRKSGAPPERRTADTRDAIRNRDACQP